MKGRAFPPRLLTIQVNRGTILVMSQDPTQIDLRTVLEAINAIGVELHQFREEVNKRFEELEAAMNERFDDLDNRMALLAGDVLKVRANAAIVKQYTAAPHKKKRA